MTIIDCHTHIGRNEHINCSVDQLLLSMDKAKIDKALVFAGEINDCPNEYLLEQISSHKDRLYGVACAPLSRLALLEDPYYIRNIIELDNVIAVKFYLGYEHYFPNDPKIYQIMNLIAERNLTAIFHCGDCLSSIRNAKIKFAHPLLIDEVAVDFPNTNIVIAHVGYPWHRDTAQVCYKNKNVYTDISGFVYGDFSFNSIGQFKKMIEEFVEITGSTDKLIFGSDFPISNQKSYVDTVKSVFYYPNDKIINGLFIDNPKKCFNLT